LSIRGLIVQDRVSVEKTLKNRRIFLWGSLHPAAQTLTCDLFYLPGVLLKAWSGNIPPFNLAEELYPIGTFCKSLEFD